MPNSVAAPPATSTSPACDSHNAKKLPRSNTGGETPGKLHSKSGANCGMPNSSARNSTPTHKVGLAIKLERRISADQIGKHDDADRAPTCIGDRQPIGAALGHRGQRVAQRCVGGKRRASSGFSRPHALGDFAQSEKLEAAAFPTDKVTHKGARGMLD